MRLFAGCYERFLFGFDVVVGADGEHGLTKTFCKPAHRSAVKCIDSEGDYVVTGGSDDQIHLYNMSKEKDLGFLVNPVDGPVPSICLFKPTGQSQPKHMLSGTNDGSICIWKAGGDWEHLKVMKGHKGAVNSMSVHPSGTLALSVSRDKQMRLWDLTKGACAYQAPIGGEGEFVHFLPGGDLYVVACGTTMTVHSTKGELVGTLKHERRVLSCAALSATTLVSGCEGGSLQVWDVRKSESVAELAKAHASRIRGMTAFSMPNRRSSCVASVSSDGLVKLWDADAIAAGKAGAMSELSAGARFTCITHLKGKKGKALGEVGVKASKRKAKDAELGE